MKQEEICPGIRREGNCISIDLSVYFSNSDAVPAKTFVDSINGMNMMLAESRLAILKLLGIDGGQDAVLYLQTVRNGSKISDFIFRIFLGSDEETNATADTLHKRFGINKILESKHVQNVLITALIAFVVRDVAVKYMTPDKVGPTIEATNSVILNAGHDLNLPEGTIEKVFSECIVNRPKASKGALLALQPATMKEDTLVKIGGRDGAEVPPVVITNMPPPSVIKTQDIPARYNMTGARIGVMACDIDRRKSGWAVKMPADSPFPGKRIPAQLDPSVDPVDLMYKREIKADITVYQDSKGKPQRVVIQNVIADASEADS